MVFLFVVDVFVFRRILIIFLWFLVVVRCSVVELFVYKIIYIVIQLLVFYRSKCIVYEDGFFYLVFGCGDDGFVEFYKFLDDCYIFFVGCNVCVGYIVL